MTTPDVTTNPPTGPRTESGKARSSRNALKNGLFSANDFLLEGEHTEYDETLSELWADLQPEGILEETFTAEIMSANWRLRRCRLVEADLSTRDLSDEEFAAEHKSLIRARAQSHSILRRSLAELRKLQSERAVRKELGTQDLPLLVDSRQVIQTVRAYHQNLAHNAKTVNPADNPDTLLNQFALADLAIGMKTPLDSSFCKTTLRAAGTTARNAFCPCGSGAKFKRCCGKDAPPVLNQAA
jgi:uncharacterized protein YecA (UPF0149 family)